jgi:Domain of unknown function (DUF5703)
MRTLLYLSLLAFFFSCLHSPIAAQSFPAAYNVVWNSQSKDASGSMPCGGGNIGLNVWVEKDELLIYMASSGAFDEHNALLKQGRIRVRLNPNPFTGGSFKQELNLPDGSVHITGVNKMLSATIVVWVDVFEPIIHITVTGTKPVTTVAGYENWRYKDRVNTGRANYGNSYKFAPQGTIITWKDSVAYRGNDVIFYHRNRRDVTSIFDVTVHQQGLDSVKSQLLNPIEDLVVGGIMQGNNMISAGTYTGKYIDTDFKGWKLRSQKPVKQQHVTVTLHSSWSERVPDWLAGLQVKAKKAVDNPPTINEQTKGWWKQFWQRSFIQLQPGSTDTGSVIWQAGRNYQLFRYMLGCNAFSRYPTRFNGGLFTYDPSLTDTSYPYTPDFRKWGGGIFTAQNQRLVYFPLLKTGDTDVLKPQLDFYRSILHNAEMRSKVYWGHEGASFTEQIENFGLPNSAEYGWKRPPDFDKGVEYNKWLEYEWDGVLEFCLMMLDVERYTGKDISGYIPFIESCLRFFNEHYHKLDSNGHLILYPGSAAETYKMANNSSSTIAGLQTILTRLLELPASYLSDSSRTVWQTMLSRLPPINFRKFGSYTTISPAKSWQRVQNTESPQLYPVFPWGLYGIGKPGLDTAINTYLHDTDVVKFKSHVGWKQYNIFAARLGLAAEATSLTLDKLKNSGRRFPAFWGPGYDWVPDCNWGGSGMIGLQEMILQTDGKKIRLFPAWPKEWDVHFKLHAPYNTTVEAVLKNGKLQSLVVTPESRKEDVILPWDTATKYLFYTHGGVVTGRGNNAVTEAAPEWGPYEYSNILDSLRRRGFNVFSEIRQKDVDDSVYANKISKQIDSLLKAGVPARNILVSGASAGWNITLHVAALLKNKDMHYVIMGGCWPDTYKDYTNLELYGHFLSIIEKSDPHGTCYMIFDKRKHVESCLEITLTTGLSHGFIYKGHKEWIDPVMMWFNK